MGRGAARRRAASGVGRTWCYLLLAAAHSGDHPLRACLQGIKWVMKREEAAGLRIIQQGQHKYIDTVRGVCGAGLGSAPPPRTC